MAECQDHKYYMRIYDNGFDMVSKEQAGDWNHWWWASEGEVRLYYSDRVIGWKSISTGLAIRLKGQ